MLPLDDTSIAFLQTPFYVEFIGGLEQGVLNYDYDIVIGSIDPRSEYNNTTHYVSNITLKDILIKEEILTEKYKNYETSYSKNINFITSGNSIIGSKIEYDDSLNYGKNYKIEIL